MPHSVPSARVGSASHPDADPPWPARASEPLDAVVPFTPRLPVAYAEALAMSGAGIDRDTMASRLAIPVESLNTLLRIATAKLHALLDADRGRPNERAAVRAET